MGFVCNVCRDLPPWAPTQTVRNDLLHTGAWWDSRGERQAGKSIRLRREVNVFIDTRHSASNCEYVTLSNISSSPLQEVNNPGLWNTLQVLRCARCFHFVAPLQMSVVHQLQAVGLSLRAIERLFQSAFSTDQDSFMQNKFNSPKLHKNTNIQTVNSLFLYLDLSFIHWSVEDESHRLRAERGARLVVRTTKWILMTCCWNTKKPTGGYGVRKFLRRVVVFWLRTISL